MAKKILAKLLAIRESKFLKNYLAFVITCFLFLNIGTALAQTTGTTTTEEETVSSAYEDLPKIDIVKSYEAMQEVRDPLSGVTGTTTLSYSDNQIASTAFSLLMSLSPASFSNYEDLLSSNASDLSKYGVIGMVDRGVYTMLENTPSVNLYAHLGKEWIPGYDSTQYSSFAASDGYTFLMEIGADNLWEKMRTIAYILFVVILIAAGFMIMFRQKVGGQVAVSLFNALPNIIVGLILVTFSFAIVGLVLNLSTMLINVFGNLLDPTGEDLVFINNPFSLVGQMFDGTFYKYTIGQTLAGGGSVLLIAGIVGMIGATASTGGAALVGITIGILIILFVVAAVLLYASVRVYITIITAYLGILLDTILAPIVLAVSSIPGQQSMSGDWFRRILRNALTFPVVFFFVNLGAYILKGELNIGFPRGLTSGSFANAETDTTYIGWVLKGFLVVAMYFFAADAPKILTDFLPSNQGKGVAEAIGGFKKGLSKIPLVGGFVGA